MIVRIPGLLRSYAGGAETVELLPQPPTLADALAQPSADDITVQNAVTTK